MADITDVYAFPSPERPGHLVVVLNTLPFAPPSALFSDGLVYRLRIRPLTAGAGDGPVPFAIGAQEFAFDCVFSDPARDDGAQGRVQEGVCTTPSGERVSFSVDQRGAARVTAFAPSPARAGIRSSWTPPRR
jgi:hypothetical protein